MNHTLTKIVSIMFIIVIFQNKYTTAPRDRGGSRSSSEWNSFDGESSASQSRWSSFDLTESSRSRGPRYTDDGMEIVDENKPMSYEDIPKTCSDWIWYGQYNHNSIWVVAFTNFQAKHGTMETEAFCNMFGIHVPVTKYLTTMESTMQCHSWIVFVGYRIDNSGVDENKTIAELRSIKSLDLYISDWPFMYGLFLIDPSNVLKLTPMQYCEQILQRSGHLPAKSENHELLKQQYLS